MATVEPISDPLVVQSLKKSRIGAGRKYKFDDGAFETRSPDMAYWLGFIIADGNVYHRDGGKPSVSPTLQFTLQAGDAGHLLKLNAFLRSDSPIHYSKKTLIRVDGSQIKSGPAARIAYRSKPLCDSLKALGIEQRKSTREVVPTGFEFDRDMWRGIVDGDGWVSWRPSPRYKTWYVDLGVCGSRDVCEGFARFVVHYLPSALPLISSRPSLTALPLWRTSIHGRMGIEVARLLYSDASTFLDRKMQRAAELLSLDWPEREPKYCVVPDCGRPRYAHSFCWMHYKRNKKHGSPYIVQAVRQPIPAKLCDQAGCGKVHFARGLCRSHYRSKYETPKRVR